MVIAALKGGRHLYDQITLIPEIPQTVRERQQQYDDDDKPIL